jgi:pSer/pThr/pTyr-binding forkhead associated (FHA) protein
MATFIPTKRVTKIGRFVIVTDASFLPRGVVSTQVKHADDILREMNLFFKEADLGDRAQVQLMIDTQHYGLVEKLSSRSKEEVAIECPRCDETIRIKIAATTGRKFLLLNCRACDFNFVSDVESIKEGKVKKRKKEEKGTASGAAGSPAAASAAAAEEIKEPEPPKEPEIGFLEVVEGKDQGLRVKLDRPRLTIGRDEVDIKLNDVRISRLHAEVELVKTPDGKMEFVLRDLGSTNGTFLNGEKVGMSAGLHNQDKIKVGKSTLLFSLSPEAFKAVEAGLVQPIAASAPPVPGKVEPPPRETKIYLDIIEGLDKDKNYEFTRENVVLGRGDANVVLKDSKVSRKHAEIELRGGYTPILRDLESSNGTFVNGRRVEASLELKDGDRIQVGDTVIKFSILRSL